MMMRRGQVLLKAAICIAAAGALTACGTFGRDDDTSRNSATRARDEQGGIGVNSFLWRATLDTLNFMPLTSADAFGGVVITDWHANPNAPNERFKATVYILDTRLRADALNVSIFRQEMVGGVWQDAAVSAETAIQIENEILRRARELRLSAIGR
jgi:hypothetical protein